MPRKKEENEKVTTPMVPHDDETDEEIDMDAEDNDDTEENHNDNDNDLLTKLTSYLATFPTMSYPVFTFPSLPFATEEPSPETPPPPPVETTLVISTLPPPAPTPFNRSRVTKKHRKENTKRRSTTKHAQRAHPRHSY